MTCKPRLDIIPGQNGRWVLVEVQETRQLLGVFRSLSEVHSHLERLDLSRYAGSELAGLQRKATRRAEFDSRPIDRKVDHAASKL